MFLVKLHEKKILTSKKTDKRFLLIRSSSIHLTEQCFAS